MRQGGAAGGCDGRGGVPLFLPLADFGGGFRRDGDGRLGNGNAPFIRLFLRRKRFVGRCGRGSGGAFLLRAAVPDGGCWFRRPFRDFRRFFRSFRHPFRGRCWLFLLPGGRDGGMADGAFPLVPYAGGIDGKGIVAYVAAAGDGGLFFRFILDFLFLPGGDRSGADGALHLASQKRRFHGKGVSA